jgi:hypothetical protein
MKQPAMAPPQLARRSLQTTMAMAMNNNADPVWLAAGLRTPFARVDGDLKHLDAIALSVPVVRAMAQQLVSVASGSRPDFLVWGTVMPNLGVSNIAREVVLDSGLGPATPAFSTVLACSTSMAAAFEAASMLGRGGRDLALAGGSESMSRVQFGLNQNFSDWMRRLFQARTLGQRLDRFAQIKVKDVRLFIPTVTNRTTGKSMGEHCEAMVQEWNIARDIVHRRDQVVEKAVGHRAHCALVARVGQPVLRLARDVPCLRHFLAVFAHALAGAAIGDGGNKQPHVLQLDLRKPIQPLAQGARLKQPPHPVGKILGQPELHTAHAFHAAHQCQFSCPCAKHGRGLKCSRHAG